MHGKPNIRIDIQLPEEEWHQQQIRVVHPNQILLFVLQVLSSQRRILFIQVHVDSP